MLSKRWFVGFLSLRLRLVGLFYSDMDMEKITEQVRLFFLLFPLPLRQAHGEVLGKHNGVSLNSWIDNNYLVHPNLENKFRNNI